MFDFFIDFVEYVFDVLPRRLAIALSAVLTSGLAYGAHVLHDNQADRLEVCRSSFGTFAQGVSQAVSSDCTIAKYLAPGANVAFYGLIVVTICLVLWFIFTNGDEEDQRTDTAFSHQGDTAFAHDSGAGLSLWAPVDPAMLFADVTRTVEPPGHLAGRLHVRERSPSKLTIGAGSRASGGAVVAGLTL